MKNKYLFLALILLILPLLVIGCRDEEVEYTDLRVRVLNEQEEEIEAEVMILKEDQEVIEQTGAAVEFLDLPAVEYEIRVGKRGYQTVYEKIDLVDEATYEIVLEQEVEQIEQIEQEVEAKEYFDLSVVVKDRNNNPLDAKTVLLKDDKIIDSSGESKINFSNLKVGSYEINISKKGYLPVMEEIELLSDKSQEIILTGGPIEQQFLTNGDKIDINGLKKGQEVIVALTPLDFNNHKQIYDYNLEAVYYNYSGSGENDDLAANKQSLANHITSFEEEIEATESEIIKEQQAFTQLEEGQSYEFRDSEEFYVPSSVKLEADGNKVEAKMAGRGKHIYVFVDERMDLELEKVDKLVEQFDNNIYPTLTGLFGPPTDVDNNGRVMALLTEFESTHTSGAFNPQDLQQEVEGTNFNDILYLNIGAGAGNNLHTALAHQFQHLLFHKNKVLAGRNVDDRWINEGIAKLAENLTGYIDYGKEGWSWDGGNNWVYSVSQDNPGYFMLTEQISLLDNKVNIPSLGATALYTVYLRDQYGIELIQEIVKSSRSPKAVIESETGLSFEQVYLNWITANIGGGSEFINSSSYNYKDFVLAKKPVMIEIDNDYNEQLEIKGGAVQYIKLYGQDSDIQLLIDGLGDKFGAVKIINNLK